MQFFAISPETKYVNFWPFLVKFGTCGPTSRNKNLIKYNFFVSIYLNKHANHNRISIIDLKNDFDPERRDSGFGLRYHASK